MIRSPLRYPGGKSKIVTQLGEFLPQSISEFREPMVGGGSLFIYIKQKFPEIKVRINDLNRDIYCFWKIAKEVNTELVEEIKRIKKNCHNGKKLFDNLKFEIESDKISDFERAVNFFVLNRISFSGLTTSGGYSKDAFKNRFTASSIERIIPLEGILQDVNISHGDYSNLLNGRKKQVLIYLDPPYFKNKTSRLYGKNGQLHLNFNHNLFYKEVISCNHNILISYDNSVKNIQKFRDSEKFHFLFINMQYGMNNVAKSRIPKKRELIITNYKINKNFDLEMINNQNEIHNSLKIQIASSIIEEIDRNVGHWKKLSALQKYIFNKKRVKTSITEQNFNSFFQEFITILKNEKYLDLSRRKGCGNIIFKLYKWNVDEIQNLILN